MRRRLVAICLVVAVTLGIVAVLTHDGGKLTESGVVRDSVDKRLPTSSLARPGTANADQSSGASIDERREIGGVEDIGLSGIVVDSITDAPLAAVLRCSEGEHAWVLSQSVDGRFSLDCASRVTIQVRASGYRSAEIEVEGRRELTIRLVPESIAELRVLTDVGEVMAAVPVRWNSATRPLRLISGVELTSSTSRYRGDSVVKSTDDAGVSTVAAGGGMAATMEFEDGRALPTLCVDPGERRLITVPERVTRVLLVDLDTRSPLGDLEIVVYWPSVSRSLACRLRTEVSGQVSISEVGEAVIVGLPEAAEDLELIAVGGQGVYQAAHDASSVRIDSIERSDPVVLGVRHLRGVIHLQDASTRRPVTAPVRATVRTPGDRSLPDGSRVPRSVANSPRDSLAPASERLQADGGKLVLGRKLRGAVQEALDSGASWELVLVAEGYAPAAVGLAGVHDLRELDGKTLMLEPATQRWLRIKMADGAPLSAPVTVSHPESQLQLLRQSDSASGLYGPFDWAGGELLARTGVHEWVLGSNELESSEVLERLVPVASGTIRVTGVPTPECATRLLAKRGSALGEGEFHVTAAQDKVCVFENLVPGRYVVGPEEWVFGAAIHSIQLPTELGKMAHVRAQQVEVSAGETVTVDWNPAWMVVGSISGRVRILGPGAISAKLLSVYVDAGADMDLDRGADVRLMISNRTPEILWNGDGEYSLKEGESLPSGIAICLNKGTSRGGLQDFYVDRVILPGESATVETFELMLRWEGPPLTGDAEVTLEIGGFEPNGRFLVPRHYLRDRRRWNGKHALTYAALPKRTVTVWIGGVEYDASPVAGQSRLELVVGPAKARPESEEK